MNNERIYEKYLKSKYVDFLDFNQYKEKNETRTTKKTIINEMGEV